MLAEQRLRKKKICWKLFSLYAMNPQGLPASNIFRKACYYHYNFYHFFFRRVFFLIIMKFDLVEAKEGYQPFFYRRPIFFPARKILFTIYFAAKREVKENKKKMFAKKKKRRKEWQLRIRLIIFDVSPAIYR